MEAAPRSRSPRSLLGTTPGDLALGLGMAVFATVEVFAPGGFGWSGPRWLNGVCLSLAGLALAWRRRWPTGVAVVVLAVIGTLSVLFGATESSASVFLVAVAVYSGAVHAASPLPVLVVACAMVAVRNRSDPGVVTLADGLWSWLLVTLTFAVGMGVRAGNAHSRELEARAARLEREHREVGAAIEEERRRIARELHDIVAHSLGVMVLQAGAAATELERDTPRAREALAAIRATGLDAIGEMETLLNLVRAPGPSRHPAPSLADLGAVVATSREAGLPVELTTVGRSRLLPPALEVSVFRIVQEGLTNALKHSGCAPTRVVLRFGDEDLQVEVSDDGAGPPPGWGTRRGLAGLSERVAVFGGMMSAGPRADGGWTLRAVLPVSR